ncbi:MAG: hypothetical protein PHW55_01310 [Methanothrix sp.]|nr:hypothetical protein [Methanothrix sp.]
MTRQTAAYRPSISIIEILIAAHGTSLEDGRSELSLPGFLFNMDRFFQALLSQFLRENLAGYSVLDECSLRGMISYVPGRNPHNRQAPDPRPDYVIMRGSDVVSILDAKYRDLWATSLPREMLYQLAIYALSRGPGGESAILYPTTAPEAEEAWVEVKDPLAGGGRARVVLRPVDLYKLVNLISDGRAQAFRKRGEYARRLALGEEVSSMGENLRKSGPGESNDNYPDEQSLRACRCPAHGSEPKAPPSRMAQILQADPRCKRDRPVTFEIYIRRIRGLTPSVVQLEKIIEGAVEISLP